MFVQGKIYKEVEINPQDVIEVLLNEFLDNDKYNTYVYSKDGKHQLIRSTPAYHNRTDESVIRELTDKDVEYYNALKVLEEYFEKRKKNGKKS